MLPVHIAFDPKADQLVITIPAAEGQGDVTLLALDLKQLTAEDRRKLRHVRPESQGQRPPGPKAAAP